MTFKDLWNSGSGQEEEALSGHKKIPHTSLSHISTSNTIKFLYCYSCGYKKAFEDYSSILNEKYPDLTVVGDNYPPPLTKAYLAHGIGFLKMAIIFCLIANVNPFSLIGQPTPNFWNWISSSRIYGCFMTFVICNMIEGQLVSSGAFEIYLNDVPIWSKIETNRVPSPAELFQIIDTQRLNQGSFQY